MKFERHKSIKICKNRKASQKSQKIRGNKFSWFCSRQTKNDQTLAIQTFMHRFIQFIGHYNPSTKVWDNLRKIWTILMRTVGQTFKKSSFPPKRKRLNNSDIFLRKFWIVRIRLTRLSTRCTTTKYFLSWIFVTEVSPKNLRI